jgi:hypothetical protein
MKLTLLLQIGLLVLASACTKYIPFTNKLVLDTRLTDRDIKNLQFYTSTTFELQRRSTETTAGVTRGGELKYERGEQLEIIRVKKHTPGAVLHFNSPSPRAYTAVDISFVPGDDKNTFPFEIDASLENQSELKFQVFGPIIFYDGKTWTMAQKPYLLVKRQDIRKLKKKLQTLPGRPAAQEQQPSR